MTFNRVQALPPYDYRMAIKSEMPFEEGSIECSHTNVILLVGPLYMCSMLHPPAYKKE